MSVDNPKINLANRMIEKSVHVDAIGTLYYFEFNDNFEDEFEEHSAWELVYVDRGECTIIADEDSLVLHQGQMYFHKPFEKHMIKVPKNELPNIFIIEYDSTSAAFHCLESKIIDVSMNIKQHIVAIIHAASLIFEDLNAFEITYRKDRHIWAGEQSILNRFELMLIELVRETTHNTTKKKLFLSKKVINDEFCIKIIEYMGEMIYSKLTLDQISEKMSYSKSYISKHFYEVCGFSVMEYFTMMKIEEAKILIRGTNKSFYEISEMLMLSNSHYFSSLFKKYVGMTPSQYKKSCR